MEDKFDHLIGKTLHVEKEYYPDLVHHLENDPTDEIHMIRDENDECVGVVDMKYGNSEFIPSDWELY